MKLYVAKTEERFRVEWCFLVSREVEGLMSFLMMMGRRGMRSGA